MKKNKGFSMVELIIVIAIMAILAGALAPALIKYIAKSKMSVDMTTAEEIAKAMVVVLTDNEDIDAVIHDTTPQAVSQMDGPKFKEAVCKELGVDSADKIKGKTKKDADGNVISNEFYYKLDTSKNKVEVYYGDQSGSADYMIYPTTGKKLPVD